MKNKVILEYVGDYPSGESPDPSNTGIISLEFALEHHGGYTFNMELPDGSFAPVSLEEFRGKDPKTTFIVLGVELIYDGPRTVHVGKQGWLPSAGRFGKHR